MRMNLLDEYIGLYKQRNSPTPKTSRDVYLRLSEIWIQLTDKERAAINIRVFQQTFVHNHQAPTT